VVVASSSTQQCMGEESIRARRARAFSPPAEVFPTSLNTASLLKQKKAQQRSATWVWVNTHGSNRVRITVLPDSRASAWFCLEIAGHHVVLPQLEVPSSGLLQPMIRR